MGTQTNNFPDGCAPVKNAGGTSYPPGEFYIPNPPAPEEEFPPYTGDDESWVAGVGGAKGYQPITANNPNGDYAGTSPMSGSATGLRRDGSFMPD